MAVAKTLEGKVALVTGSGRGIGRAIAVRLGQHGAAVAVNYAHAADAAEKVAEEIRQAGSKAITVKADVSQPTQIKDLFDTVIKELGRVDIVMSNSGIEHFGAVDEVKPEDIDRVFAINVRAQYLVAQQAYTHMSEGGRLLLISSISAQRGFPRHAIYSASKAAIQGMVKSLAFDFGPKGITVNAIAPGGIKTDMWTEAAADYLPDGKTMTPEAIDKAVSSWSPFNRPGLPDDIAGVVAILATPESQWLTGQTFQVGGGAFMV